MVSDSTSYICVNNNFGKIIKKKKNYDGISKNGKPVVRSGESDAGAEKPMLMTTIPTFIQQSYPSVEETSPAAASPRIAVTVLPTMVVTKSVAVDNCEILRSNRLENTPAVAATTASKQQQFESEEAPVMWSTDESSSYSNNRAGSVTDVIGDEKNGSYGAEYLKNKLLLDSPAVARARHELVRCRKALIEAAIHPQLRTYVPPAFYKGPTYTCEECEDSFVSNNGLNNHMNRRCVLFTYACPVCKKMFEFYNRCMFLLHVRSHKVTVKACFLNISIIPASKLNFPVREQNDLLPTLNQEDNDLLTMSDATADTLPKSKNCNKVSSLSGDAIVNGKTETDNSATVSSITTCAVTTSSSSSQLHRQTHPVTICTMKTQKKQLLSTLLMKPMFKNQDLDPLSATYTTTNSTTTTNNVGTINVASKSVAEELYAGEIGSANASNLPFENADGNMIGQSVISEDRIQTISSEEDEGMSELSKKSGPVRCRECQKVVPNLSSHYRAANRPMQAYPCKTCKFLNPSACALSAHMRIHTRSVPFVCPDCGFYFNSIDAFRTHVNNVCFYGFKTIRFKCPKCLLLQPSVMQFRYHLRRYHTRNVYKCRICTTSSYSSRVVQTHMERMHPDVPCDLLEGYHCMLCPNTLVSKHSIDVHMKKHLSGLQHLCYVYVCEFCKQYTSNCLSSFKEHYNACKKLLSEDGRVTAEKLANVSILSEKQDAQLAATDVIVNSEKDPLSVDGDEADEPEADYTAKTKLCVLCHTAKLNAYSKSLLCNVCVRYVNADGTSADTSAKATSTDGVAADTLKVAEGVGRSKRKIKCKLCKQFLNRDWSAIANHYLRDHNANFDASVSRGLSKSSSSSSLAAANGGDVARSGRNGRVGVRSRARKRKLAPPSKQSTDTGAVATTTTPATTTSRTISTCANTRSDVAGRSRQPSTPTAPILPLAKVAKVERKYRCVKCGFGANSRQDFHEHIVSHKTRSNTTNYQCLECGELFIVRPSLEKHLSVLHEVHDIGEYYEQNKIGDGDESSVTQTLTKYQCEVCNEEYDCEQQYNRHIRTHGMAFVALQSRTKS